MSTQRDDIWRQELRSSMKAKERTSIERAKMPEEPADVRNKSHIEVNKGFTMEMAVQEAKRCLDCVTPTCMNGCPVGINIPGFIKYIEVGDFKSAVAIIKESNVFPAICGRVCPQEVQCEAQCFYKTKMQKVPVSIGNLERFAADQELASGTINIPEVKGKIDKKVAVVGSGPAGLAAACDLAQYGYKVTIFEALHDFGGVLKYGIPEFRLPNHIIDSEISTLQKLGVQFEKNFVVGKIADFDDLKLEGYEAFFVGSGAGLPNFMKIPGENFIGVMSSNEYLTRVNLMNAHKDDYDTPVLKGLKVAVIGGGNTAMDSVRTAKRLGAEKAYIIYRRSFDEMPARKEEIHHAIEEGIEFLNLTNPVRYLANEKGRVNKVIVNKMGLGEPDASGRRKPIVIEGSEYEIEIDMAVVSIGVSPNPIIPKSVAGLKTNAWGTIIVNPVNMQSSIPEIFAGGDIVRGGATVILAMGDGRKAAKGIHEYLEAQK